ncbi:teichoic acid biosynthesis protein C [Streptomyces kunmingensis]|uniref:Teichoic acid biosynthesis protein C n=1 Tax=Streptomyces kunmingensis TaxID=68225 RepID=A0ABU6C3V4_9ACTN|nr:teichoic acid biosynthesis protein C [Streptomyces kunmingensis]MEB3958866.1 teichoic acid biosynthesis protein C [Streptomyces kunmingensis]
MARFLPQPPTRRDALGLAALTTLGLVLPAATARADTTRTEHGTSGLAASGTPWLTGRRLRHGTVLQSFAFDESHHCLYALQVMPGGIRLPGEKHPYTHAERAHRGDLCLNRLSLRGRRTGYMYLKGFGHGGAMGVEQHRKGSRLWTEWDAHPASGYGRGICRFRFANKRVLTRAGAHLTAYHPVPGSTSNSVTLDQSRRRLLLRYKIEGTPRFAVYDLARFVAGHSRPLADLAQPDAYLGLPFQGMALDGNTVYQLMGSGYGPDNPSESGGNTYLGRTNWRTGSSHQSFPDHTAPHLSPREPEGLAVRRSDRRLYLGFTQGAPGDRRFSLYSKGLR